MGYPVVNSVVTLGVALRRVWPVALHAEAVRVAERRNQYQPGTLGSLRGLVDAYEANGQIEDAVAALKAAIERARADGDGDVESLRERLESLESRLVPD